MVYLHNVLIPSILSYFAIRNTFPDVFEPGPLFSPTDEYITRSSERAAISRTSLSNDKLEIRVISGGVVSNNLRVA